MVSKKEETALFWYSAQAHADRVLAVVQGRNLAEKVSDKISPCRSR